MDKTVTMICQHLYWPHIIDAVWKELTNYDTCQHMKQSNKKYGKLLVKLTKGIPYTKLCVDITGTFIRNKKGRKDNLHLKFITMIDPVTGWFEIT